MSRSTGDLLLQEDHRYVRPGGRKSGLHSKGSLPVLGGVEMLLANRVGQQLEGFAGEIGRLMLGSIPG
ncbi:MAG: hypothetical protein M3P51_06515 [Chloroflexota bacterium]|nr:hypothetical protein [Chloroflexota bacterium]